LNDATSDRHVQAAHRLGTHPDYRVQRRLVPVTHSHAARPEASSHIGVAIDVETTGLDRQTDRIIELAIQLFRFDELRFTAESAVLNRSNKTIGYRSALAHFYDNLPDSAPASQVRDRMASVRQGEGPVDIWRDTTDCVEEVSFWQGKIEAGLA
jgi:hypothetical protein